MTYTATVTREGRWWAIKVPGVGVTQARNLREVEDMTRSLISIMREIPEDTLDIIYDIKVGDVDVTDLRNRFDAARTAVADLEPAVKRAAVEMKSAGIPLRDIGSALGLSHQRVHQLVS